MANRAHIYTNIEQPLGPMRCKTQGPRVPEHLWATPMVIYEVTDRCRGALAFKPDSRVRSVEGCHLARRRTEQARCESRTFYEWRCTLCGKHHTLTGKEGIQTLK